MWWKRPSEVCSRALADADLVARLVDAVADASGATIAGADHGDGRDGHWHVFVDDAALHRRLGGPLVLLGHVHAFDDDLVVLGQHPHHRARLPAVLAAEHDDPVALLDLDAHHRTSRATELIRM